MNVLHLLKAPDFVSIINLIFGIFAIICAFSGAYGVAAACLLVAAAADGLDGYVARKTSSGPLGAYLDSLIDAVSFGVAPAIIIYCMSESLFSIVFVCSYIICGILRLARFDAFPPKTPGYSGVPITGASVVLAVIIILNMNLERAGFPGPYTVEFLSVFMFILALMMVSSIPYPKVMKKSVFFLLIILFLGTVVSVFIESIYLLVFPLVLGILLLMYLISPIFTVFGKKKKIEL